MSKCKQTRCVRGPCFLLCVVMCKGKAYDTLKRIKAKSLRQAMGILLHRRHKTRENERGDFAVNGYMTLVVAVCNAENEIKGDRRERRKKNEREEGCVCLV